MSTKSNRDIKTLNFHSWEDYYHLEELILDLKKEYGKDGITTFPETKPVYLCVRRYFHMIAFLSELCLQNQ